MMRAITMGEASPMKLASTSNRGRFGITSTTFIRKVRHSSTTPPK